MTKKALIYLQWHIGFWGIYLAFKIYHEYVWIYPKHEDLGIQQVLFIASMSQVGVLMPKILFTYWVAFWLLPVSKRPLVKLGLFFAGLVTTALLFRLSVYLFVQPALTGELASDENLFSLPRISSSIIDILLVAGMGSALVLLHKQQLARNREKELEKEKVTAELTALRQQTNPHFLLNTLNNLYVLARKKSDRAPDVIIKLAELFKFMLYGNTEAYIPLAKEVELILHYVDLERLRFGDQLELNLAIEEALDGLYIAPLLLLPLVENAFKHGAFENIGENKVEIVLQLEDKCHLQFSVVNSISTLAKPSDQGIGLKNLERQLELQYKAFSLVVTPSDQQYRVDLSIDLSEENQVSYP
ncbi:MAG: histidine kinase [Bacteroidota bacterium]